MPKRFVKFPKCRGAEAEPMTGYGGVPQFSPHRKGVQGRQPMTGCPQALTQTGCRSIAHDGGLRMSPNSPERGAGAEPMTGVGGVPHYLPHLSVSTRGCEAVYRRNEAVQVKRLDQDCVRADP